MIHNIHRRSFTRIVAMLALTGWLAGCGFKGPLYLPPPKPGAKRPATAPQTPATQEDADPDSLDLNTNSTSAQTNNKP
ncbi:MAG: lipoprotein [Burkholderiaceae bacterium]|nr:lipoprotein [Burkholderiaceae bacterium]